MKVFEFMILSKTEERIIVHLTAVLAKDEEVARMKASRAIPLDYENRLNELEILVRPF